MTDAPKSERSTPMIWKYFLAWFGMMVLAVLNGGIRDLVYSQSLGGPAAHQVSTVTLILLLAGYFWLVVRIVPFRSRRHAWAIGLLWFALTEIFEFGMGILAGKPWSELLQAYNLFAGELWILIPLWVLVGPPVFFRYVQRR